MPSSKKYLPVRWLLRWLLSVQRLKRPKRDEDDTPAPGRWYNAGIERTCSMLVQAGYTIVEPDVGTCLRDPIIHVMKV